MYYSSADTSSIKLIKTTTVFSSINELYIKLENIAWDEMTCFKKSQWNPSVKCCGQCNATVLLVQEYFGGDIIEYSSPSKDKLKHFFNRINSIDIDLTSEQFSPQLTQYNVMTKLANFNGNLYQYEKSAYILKLKLGLV